MTQKNKPRKTTGASKAHKATINRPESSPSEGHSSLELDESVSREGYDINLGGKRMGGPTGGDLAGGGRGPAIGSKHPADDSTADHYGSREETNAALEDKIAIQNTLKLHEY
ncbi:hypothetical protein [Vampirovibrio chlorellavorus]|uniref:hypothetical protein n=1 Tax=Vampirovibrio chlorellavorus TaxID=758823 RepID=UPI0026EA65B5|nr:hypothetical protein [Vampirovibrio chlorellavorus]